MSDRVTITVEGGVADVRLNRPDKLNAFDLGMFTALAEAGESLKHDPSVRAVVLSGEGRAFCSGLDFSVFESMADDGGAGGGAGGSANAGEPRIRLTGERGDRITNLGQQSVYVWTESPCR